MKYLALVAVLFASPALGQGQIGDWEVIATPDNCVATNAVLGTARPTLLSLVAMFDNGPYGIVMTNSGWSLVEDNRYDLMFLIDDRMIAGTALARNGVLLSFVDSDIMDSVASADRLTAFLVTGPDSEQMLEQFPLSGSAAAIAEMRECAFEQTEFLAAQRRRAELIPADPFAP